MDNLWNAIFAIISEWDPIDLFPFAPENEYQIEAEKIYNEIAKNKTYQTLELADFINHLFLNAFGEDVFLKSDETLDIAKKIIVERNRNR